MGIISEFKEFAMRGNVVDLAVGVVIGAAFGKIVSSLVDDMVMPLVGTLMGGVNFADLAVLIAPARLGPDGKEIAAAVLLKYGAFLQSVLDFALVAFAVFLMIKMINRLQRRRAQAPVAPPAPSEEIVLLTQIRDALQTR